MPTFHAVLLASFAACSAATASVVAPTSELDCKALGGECEKNRNSGTEGISLMQSGRSVLPAVEHTSDSFDMLDEYDAFLPTGDAGAVKSSLDAQAAQAQAAQVFQVSLPEHFSDPRFYIMALVYAIGFSIIAKLFRRWQSGSEANDEEDDEEEELPKSTSLIGKKTLLGENGSNQKLDSNAAPIFALGASDDFATLAKAVLSGDEAQCLHLVKSGTVVRKEDSCGCTALHLAAQCGSPVMAKILLEHGAAVNAREAWEETPLHIAARGGSTEVCELLLEHGAEIDSVNANGRTPLLEAAQVGKEDACEMLLAKGAGVAGKSDGELPPMLNALLFRRMFAGAKPQDFDVDDNEDTEVADFE